MAGERHIRKKEFERIVNKNLNKWKRLNHWLATERLAEELIKAREAAGQQNKTASR